MTSCIYEAIQGDTAGRLQLELGWLSVVESVDNEINTVAIANSQTNGTGK